MKNNEFEDLETEVLVKRQKTLKFVRAVFGFCLFLICGLMIYSIFREERSTDIPMGVILICIFGGLSYNHNNIRAIKSELKYRKQNQTN